MVTAGAGGRTGAEGWLHWKLPEGRISVPTPHHASQYLAWHTVGTPICGVNE